MIYRIPDITEPDNAAKAAVQHVEKVQIDTEFEYRGSLIPVSVADNFDSVLLLFEAAGGGK